jgi:hypothetical protein
MRVANEEKNHVFLLLEPWEQVGVTVVSKIHFDIPSIPKT